MKDTNHGLSTESVQVANKEPLQYKVPEINLSHIKRLSTGFGIVQFFTTDQFKNNWGYTLDDNARALIVMCNHYELKRDEADLYYIHTYFNFIKHCLQPEGYFLNYTNPKGYFTEQNNSSNLADANGKAIWALGYLVSLREIIPAELVVEAETIMQKVLARINLVHSTRAIAFTIKGLYYYNKQKQLKEISLVIKGLANKLVQMYKHESEKGWNWFERYLSYANSILPQALLCAYRATSDHLYKDIAKTSFDFLLSYMLSPEGIKINSIQNQNGEETRQYGEHPLNASYTILALAEFYEVFDDRDYLDKMEKAFNWFLGDNQLQRVIYDDNTGGCYNGLQRTPANYQQGTGSTLGYMMARLTMEKYFNSEAFVSLRGNFGTKEELFSNQNDDSQKRKQVA